VPTAITARHDSRKQMPLACPPSVRRQAASLPTHCLFGRRVYSHNYLSINGFGLSSAPACQPARGVYPSWRVIETDVKRRNQTLLAARRHRQTQLCPSGNQTTPTAASIPHAARSETSSNSWKLSVVRDAPTSLREAFRKAPGRGHSDPTGLVSACRLDGRSDSACPDRG
jgi:hypothetical protein